MAAIASLAAPDAPDSPEVRNAIQRLIDFTCMSIDFMNKHVAMATAMRDLKFYLVALNGELKMIFSTEYSMEEVTEAQENYIREHDDDYTIHTTIQEGVPGPTIVMVQVERRETDFEELFYCGEPWVHLLRWKSPNGERTDGAKLNDCYAKYTKTRAALDATIPVMREVLDFGVVVDKETKKAVNATTCLLTARRIVDESNPDRLEAARIKDLITAEKEEAIIPQIVELVKDIEAIRTHRIRLEPVSVNPN
jgi:hypothetical protein